MKERWERLADALMPGAHTTWQSQWDAKKLRNINENVWINLAIVERAASGEMEEDWRLWQDEL